MIIAVNTLSLLNDPEGCDRFVYELFLMLAKKRSEDRFYLLSDRNYKEIQGLPPNVYLLEVSTQSRDFPLRRYWLNIKILLILKKTKADVFVSFGGTVSYTARLPNCLVIPDSELHHQEASKKSHWRYIKRRMPWLLKKAKQVVCLSELSKNGLTQNYRIDASKIDVVYPAAKDIFHPLSWEEKSFVKEKYTDGNEYFICAGLVHPEKNLVNLLKAFSLFKKRMQSSMKLLITVGRPGREYETFLKLVETYKYKTDVIIKEDLSEKDQSLLMGAAYALVYPSLFEDFGTTVIEAMKCKAPVLTSDKTSMAEITGNAALCFDPKEPADIADKMMTIYRDENLRNQLSEKGKERVQNYSLEKSAELFWESILKTAGT